MLVLFMMSVVFGLLLSLEFVCVLFNVPHISVWKYYCLVLLVRPPVTRLFFCTHVNVVSVFSVINKIFIESYDASAAG